MIHNKNRYILILIIVFNCIVTAACYVMLTSLIGFNLNTNYPTLYDQIGFTLPFFQSLALIAVIVNILGFIYIAIKTFGRSY